MSDASATPPKGKAAAGKGKTVKEKAEETSNQEAAASAKPEKAASATGTAEKTPTAATPSGAHTEPTGEKPAAQTPAAGAKVAPAEPAETPFTVDELLNCTARFTHKAWYLFYDNRSDMEFIRTTPLRATLEARTSAGAEELHRILAEGGVREISRNDKVLSFTGTFETIQTVIKHPQSYMLDAAKL